MILYWIKGLNKLKLKCKMCRPDPKLFKLFRSILILVALFFVITSPVYPQVQGALRPQAADERRHSSPVWVVSLAEVREILTLVLQLDPIEVKKLTMHLIYYEPVVTEGFVDPRRPHLKTRHSLIKLIAEIEGTSFEEVYNRALLCEMTYHIINSTLTQSDINKIIRTLNERIGPDFISEFARENIEYRGSVFEKTPNRQYLEDIIAQYYTEKARYKGKTPPFFSRVSSAIEETMQEINLLSLWSPSLVEKLPDPMKNNPPKNLHELFDVASEYTKLNPVPESPTQDLLELKCRQLTAVLKAKDISTAVDNVDDMDGAIVAARPRLREIVEGRAKYHPFLKSEDGTPLEIEPLPKPVLTLGDIARTCYNSGVDFLQIYARSEEGKVISHAIVPVKQVVEFLKRGISIDGSSLDPNLLKPIFGEKVPTIGESGIRAVVVKPETFCVLKKTPNAHYKDAYVEVSLYLSSDSFVKEPLEVDCTPREVIFEEPETIEDIEKIIRDEQFTEIGLIYSDFGTESMEYPEPNPLRAPDPEELIMKLRRFVEEGIPVYGEVTRGFKGFACLSECADKAGGELVIVPKIPTFRVLQLPNAKRAVIVGQFQLKDPKTKDRPWEDVLGYPRNWLKTVSGYESEHPEREDIVISPEIEFYLVRSGPPIPEIGYHRNFNGTPYEIVIKDMLTALEGIGETVKYVHAEVGSISQPQVSAAQFEFVLGHGKAFKTITTKELHKWVLRQVAKAHGFEISFRPKPYAGKAGNGMHVHISMEKIIRGQRVNLFCNPEGELSETAKQFMTGLLKYIPEILFLTNQSDNSYERLVPGYEAPVYISWGIENRSAMIRIPSPIAPKVDMRLELRVPDSDGNLYLALAAIILAGRRGIEEKLDISSFPQAPEGENLYTMSATRKAALGIKQLPSSFYAALYNGYHSDFVREVVPETIRRYFFRMFHRRAGMIWRRLRNAGINVKKVMPHSIFISEAIAGVAPGQALKIGPGTTILGEGIYINGENIQIGRYVRIGGDVRIFTEGALVEINGEKKFVCGSVEIGNDVEIGEGSKIIARDNGKVIIQNSCRIPKGVEIVANQNEIVYGKMVEGNFMLVRKLVGSVEETVSSFNPSFSEIAI